MSTVSEAVVSQLKKAGVKYVFGIPGGPWVPFMDAMREEGIEFILVANEGAAAFMADVSARLTGVPGVCHGTFGPGATNLSTGVGGGLLDRSALIALTSEVPDAMMGRTTQMRIDHQTLFSPLTKETCRLNGDNPVKDILGALNLSLSGIPGSVHIGVPSDMGDAVVATDCSPCELSPIKPAPAPATSIDGVAEAISRASRPLLAIGLTAAREGLREEVSRLAEILHAPVVITPMAKGIVAEDTVYYQGVLFHACSSELAAVVSQSDLIVAVGYDPIEFNFEPWVPESIPVVNIDVSPMDIDRSIYAVAAEAVGDVKTSLEALIPKLQRSTWLDRELAAVQEKIWSRLNAFRDSFGPVTALTVLREIMPGDAILTLDVGAHLHLAGQMWRTTALNTVLMTNGWSSMGFGIPAAIAASLNRPDQQAVCVTGDGGFLMMAGELITARRLNLNTIFVVFADRELSLIAVKQDWKNVPRYRTDLYAGEYFQSDSFLGVPVYRADSEESMRNAVEKAYAEEGPAIVEAVIDGSEYNELIERKYK